jgi:DNA uptake protein ComE-like DNA-binding protein
MKSDWKAYFIFSEKELKAVIVIGIFILISTATAILFPSKPILQKRFYFDPNSLDSNAAMQLGFLPKHFKTLSKFRAKGGRFYKAKDLLKLYGVPKAQLESLLPFVRIASIPKKQYKHSQFKPWLDINRASLNDLMGLKLSPGLAKRIIRYREYLGGYQSIAQLKKVYGMSEEDYQRLRPNLLPIRANTVKMHWATMNYNQIASLGIFEPRDIWTIIHLRKEQGKELGWEELVTRFDLNKEQAYQLKAQTDIR